MYIWFATHADNHGNDQRYWDAWFRLIGNSTAQTPWQVCRSQLAYP